MIAAKAYLIGPALRVSSNVTVTCWLLRRPALRARLQAVHGPPGTPCQLNSEYERIASVTS
jgi:hypothetical protein